MVIVLAILVIIVLIAVKLIVSWVLDASADTPSETPAPVSPPVKAPSQVTPDMSARLADKVREISPTCRRIYWYTDKIVVIHSLPEQASYIDLRGEEIPHLTIEDTERLIEQFCQRLSVKGFLSRYQIPDNFTYPEWNDLLDLRGRNAKNDFGIVGLLICDITP